jgi:trehalose 6-phosphate phosphatase
MPDRRADPGIAHRPPPLDGGNALFLDFDGTLVEIAANPDAVRVAPDLPELLAALSGRLGGALAVVSGRSLAELTPLLAPFDGAMVGQHGGEIRHRDGTISRRPPDTAVREARAALARVADRHREVVIEDKGNSLALHYRAGPHLAEECRSAAREAVAAGGGRLRAIDGNRVIELLPRAIHKGEAIAALAGEPPFRGRVPVFVGDDATDEDGFAAVEALGGSGVKVGQGASAAQCRLATVADVLAWLSGGLVRGSDH